MMKRRTGMMIVICTTVFLFSPQYVSCQGLQSDNNAAAVLQQNRKHPEKKEIASKVHQCAAIAKEIHQLKGRSYHDIVLEEKACRKKVQENLHSSAMTSERRNTLLRGCSKKRDSVDARIEELRRRGYALGC